MVDEAIKEIISESPVDKYADRELPEKYQNICKAFGGENVEKLLNGDTPEGVDEEFAGKLVKIIGRKAPLALQAANELIDKQTEVSIDKAIELELARVDEMFNTEDALKGLSNLRKQVEFKGK